MLIVCLLDDSDICMQKVAQHSTSLQWEDSDTTTGCEKVLKTGVKCLNFACRSDILFTPL